MTCDRLSMKEPSNQLEFIEYSKLEHYYSPAVSALFDLALCYVEDSENGVREGRQAVWTMGVFEAPLFYACDTIPLSAIDLGRLSSGNAKAVAEEAFDLPKETCPMISILLGEWALRKNSPVRRIAAFNNACEPFNMAYELIRKSGYDVYRIENTIRPKQGGEERLAQMANFLVSELRDLAKWLNGKPVDEEKMAFEIRRMNRVTKKIRKIMELRLKNPLYMKSLPAVFLLQGSGHYYGKPDEFERVVDDLLEALSSAAIVPPPLGKIVPLTWIGARGIEFGVFKAVDDLGGALLSWFVPNAYTTNWREDLPPLQSMAHYILDYFLVSSPVHQLKGIERLVQFASAKGIIFYTYVGCAFGGVHVEFYRDYFRKLGVPSIGLDGSCEVGVPSGQLLTRVRAFTEMLQ